VNALAEDILPAGWQLWPIEKRYRLLWALKARPEQLPSDWGWFIWLILTGRGWGKTLTGAEWTAQQATEHPRTRWALVGPTLGHVRDTMVEGETGLLSVLPPSAFIRGSVEASWNRTNLELRLSNGSRLKGFSSEEPGRLRGPQHHGAWAEEIAEWKDANLGLKLDTTFSNLQIGLRLGHDPRMIVTGTPKPKKLIKELLWIDGDPKNAPRPDIAVTRGTTDANLNNLPPTYVKTVIEPYRGTRLGRQELGGELLEDVEGALWNQAMIDVDRVTSQAVPELVRIVVAVDPSGTKRGDDVGIIGAGLGTDGDAYILRDASGQYSPAEWGRKAVEVYEDLEADRIIAEVNFGADMVKAIIAGVPAHGDYPAGNLVPFTALHASRSKQVRAEPVVGRYEQHQVHHVGPLPELEDQLTTWVPAESTLSPGRLDALVWAVTDLLLKKPKRKAHF
jgi:phage terminase large subunit-like protein